MKKPDKSIKAKLNISIHRIYGKIQSSIMTFGINKGYFISIGMGFLSVFKIVFQGYIDGWSTLNYDLNTLWPFAITILSAGYTTTASIFNYKNSSHEYTIIQDSYYKNKLLSSIRLGEKQISNGYEIMSFYNGINEEKYIMSDDINIKLINGNKIKIKNLNYKFQLPDEIKKYVPSLLKRNFMSDKLIFNGKLVRMVNDFYLDSDIINVQSVRYFEGQCTNEVVYKKIKSNHSLEEPFLGGRLLIDDENILYDLEYSSCANYIGASTVVITKDKYIIVGKQGGYSRANAGRYAPTGSGSVNYADLKKSRDFNSLIISAMEREFCEENNYKIDCNDIIKTTLIGYVRLLERGGKPDFFGISFIDEYSHKFSGKIKNTELGIEDKSELIKIPDNLGIGETLIQFCQKHISEKKVSIQLMVTAQLIAKYEKDILMENKPEQI